MSDVRIHPAPLMAKGNLQCPDCGGDQWFPGPRGGLAQNITCASPVCGSKFNHLGPFGLDRNSDPQPLAKK